MKQNPYFCFMVILAISDNVIEGTGKSCRDFASKYPEFGKSHVWFSRKFKENNTFSILHAGRVFYFYRITI